MPISKTSQNKFSKLTLQDLVDTFDIKKTDKLTFPNIKTEVNLAKLQEIIDNSKGQIDYWNEQELVMKQLSFVLNLAKLQGTEYNTFAERQIHANIKGIELGGITDFLVARGFYEPRNPYFFIQEFKKAKNQSGDPLAQLLGEMLVAQELNSDKQIYGVYVIGKFWTFVSMYDLEFSEEQELNSTDLQDLQAIFDNLGGIKQYIENKFKN